MLYCENCGARLIRGNRFCENCGVSIAEYVFERQTSQGELLNSLFSGLNWEMRWKQVVDTCKQKGYDIGVILINTKDCFDLSRIDNSLTDFIIFKREQGVYYYCLDISTEAICLTSGNSNIESVLQVLHTVYSIAVPDYLLIVGDTESVGGKKWENQADPYDKYVCSDLPYWTMDLESPWSGRKYDLDNTVLVGRIPCSTKNGFSVACHYFENSINVVRSIDKINVFGLSAFQWQTISEQIYRPLGSGLLLSPEIVVEHFCYADITTLNGNVEPNLLFFNLHGSKTQNYWFGQRHDQYPAAFSSMCLPKTQGYVIGVEACYGAHQFNGNSHAKSILLEAMQNGCLAFVGSDTVAFGGTHVGAPCCADIIISQFLYGVKEGKNFGQAFLDARKVLLDNVKQDDAIMKTNAQFALYGDPSTTLIGNRIYCNNKKYLGKRKTYITLPDTSVAVRKSLINVTVQIETILSKYIDKYYGEFRDVKPTYYRLEGSQMGQAMYTKQNGDIVQILKLYYDKNGKIEREYISR